MALGDATTTIFVLVLGILALCPVVEADHSGDDTGPDFLITGAVYGVFIGIAVLVVAYQIFTMKPPKEMIHYDDHCCCWSQLNKNDGPDQFNSIEFAKMKAKSTDGCRGLQGTECAGCCFKTEYEMQSSKLVKGPKFVKDGCTMMKMALTAPKPPYPACRTLNPDSWPGYLKFIFNTVSLNHFNMGAGIVDGVWIIYKGSWIKQGCRCYGLCGLKGLLCGAYRILISIVSLGSLELCEGFFGAFIPKLCSPKSHMWDIENNVSIGCKPEKGRKISKNKDRPADHPSNSNQPRSLEPNLEPSLWIGNIEEGKTADPVELEKRRLKKLIEKSTRGFPMFGKCRGLNGNGPYGAYYGKRRQGPPINVTSCCIEPCKALVCGACNTIEDEAIGCCTPQDTRDAWVEEHQILYDAKVAKAMPFIQKGGFKAVTMSYNKAKEWVEKDIQDKIEEEEKFMEERAKQWQMAKIDHLVNAQLSQALKDSGNVKIDLEHGKVQILKDVEFELKKCDLGDDTSVLDDVASVILAITNVFDKLSGPAGKEKVYPLFNVEGHTDAENQELSDNRAKAVWTYLTSTRGCRADLLKGVGMSNTVPLPAGQNSRRVEIKLDNGKEVAASLIHFKAAGGKAKRTKKGAKRDDDGKDMDGNPIFTNPEYTPPHEEDVVVQQPSKEEDVVVVQDPEKEEDVVIQMPENDGDENGFG